MSIYSFQTHVCYDDIDHNMRLTLKGAMGYMQEAAIIHSGKVGYSVGDVSRTHVIWMLLQWRIRLEKSVSWHELLTIETCPRTIERATSIRDFQIKNRKDEIVAVGESNWVLVNADTGRIMRITPEIAAAYDLTETPVFEDSLPDIPLGDGALAYSGIVQRRDIDTNHHVNNRVYLDYALEALPQQLADASFREVHVRYRKQMLPGQKFFCYYRAEGERQIVDICGDDPSHVHGTVVFLP